MKIEIDINEQDFKRITLLTKHLEIEAEEFLPVLLSRGVKMYVGVLKDISGLINKSFLDE